MADESVAVTTLTKNTVSADVLVDAAAVESIAAGDVAVIQANNDARNLFITLYAASAATATIAAGDNPPSLNAGQGAGSAQTLDAGTVKVIAVEGGRFLQDDGTIRIAIATNAVIVAAFRIPNTV
jgi:hypothetical protein